MKVAIIVLNWNGADYITNCLDSLVRLKMDKHSIEIVVIDNASTDSSVELVTSKYPKIKLIETGQNLGYASGNNIGLQHAIDTHADWVWIVNPDIRVSPDSLSSLLSATNSTTGILGSKSYFEKGFEFHKDRYAPKDLGKVIWYAGGKMDWANVDSLHIGVNQVDHGQYDQASPTEFVTGASMLINCRMLETIGLFDPKYFLYYEENDLCQRAIRAGWQLVYVPQSVVWHANAQATGIGSNLQDYFLTRNKLLFGLRWAPFRSKLAVIRQSLNLLFTGRPWQKRGVIDFYLARMGPGSYPIK